MAAEQEATRAQQILYDIYSQAEVAQHELVELQVSAPPHQARLAEQQHIQDSRNTSLHSSWGAGPLVSGPPPCVREVHTRVGR